MSTANNIKHNYSHEKISWNFCVHKNSKGFSLIEMMVAVSIFAIVMLVATGSLLTMIEANRKAQSLKSVMNNLNFALEHMSRSIRVGTVYHCHPGSANPPPVPGGITTRKSCSNGGNLLAFEAHGGDTGNPSDQVVYRLNNTQLERSTNSGAAGTFIPITAPEVKITEFSFYVTGAERPDPGGGELQPRVRIVMKGHAGVSARTETEFSIQTTVTQRIFDF